MFDKNTSTGRLTSSLSKHVLAHNFEAAQELIDQEIPFSTGIMLKALYNNDMEAFNFLIKNDIKFSSYDIYQSFTENVSNSDKFKVTIISQKFRSKDLEEMFSNSEEYFNQLIYSMKYYTDNIYQLDILKKGNLVYDLTVPMQEVVSIKNFIIDMSISVSGFYELKEYLPKLSIEQNLQLLEWKNLIKETEEIYNNYIIDRLNLSENLSPIIKERDTLNEKIKTMIEGYQSPIQSNKIKM